MTTNENIPTCSQETFRGCPMVEKPLQREAISLGDHGRVAIDYPRLQESQILQNSSEILANFAFLTRILQVCKKIAIFARLIQSTIFLAKFLQKFCKICVLHTKILTKFAFLIFDYFDQKFVQIFFQI